MIINDKLSYEKLNDLDSQLDDNSQDQEREILLNLALEYSNLYSLLDQVKLRIMYAFYYLNSNPNKSIEILDKNT